MYTEKVMDHFMHPRNVGEIDNASGVGTVGNAKCGDIMRIFLDIDENPVSYTHLNVSLPILSPVLTASAFEAWSKARRWFRPCLRGCPARRRS